MKSLKTISKAVLVISLLGLVACQNTNKTSSFTNSISNSYSSNKSSLDINNLSINFYIDNNKTNVKIKNGVFEVPYHSKKQMHFMGWSYYKDGDVFSFESELEIKLDEVKNYFANGNTIDLFANYEDEASVITKGNVEKTYILYSKTLNSISLEEPIKEGYRFMGWTNIENSSEVIFKADLTINYTKIASYLNSNKILILYPVFELYSSNIDLYPYSKAEQMASIHINTMDGIAIDDKSLINPNEHKGKDGELPVYDYVGATISVSDCETEYALSNVEGQVKVRGNYTSTYKKKPIRIKFNNKQKMLGLNNNNKFKSWVLLAEWKDSSLLRNAIANYVGNSILETEGCYCSDFRFVNVYLNGQYNGVYLLVEQQQIDPYRVNIPESKLPTDDVKTGYMLELDGYYINEPALQRFTISYQGIKNLTGGFTITNDINNQAQHDYVAKCVQNIYKVIYDAIKNDHSSLVTYPYHTLSESGDYIVDSTITSSHEAIDKVLDIKSLLNMYILHEICQDRDLGWSSFYFSLDMSENGSKKITFNAPWDFDYAMGNSTFSNAMRADLANQSQMINDGRLKRNSYGSYKFSSSTELKASDFRFTNKEALYVRNNDNPWLSIFCGEEWFAKKVSERWNEIKNTNVFPNCSEMIDFYNEKYNSYFDNNFTKWGESMGLKLDQYQPTLVSYFVNHKQATDYLKIWFNARIEGLDQAIKTYYGNL